MVSLGITGGIGAGKSTVCQIFRLLHIPIFDADNEAKRLNNESPILREFYKREIDSNLYVDDRLDTKRLASILFSDKDKRKLINDKVHGVLADSFKHWLAAHHNYDVVVLDAALLFEANFDTFVDYSVLVSAPEALRLQRATLRDKVSDESIRQRMRAQMSEEDKKKRADYIIYNDDKQSIIVQSLALFNNLVQQPEMEI